MNTKLLSVLGSFVLGSYIIYKLPPEKIENILVHFSDAVKEYAIAVK